MLIGLLVVIFLSTFGIGLPNSLLGAAWPAMYEQMSVPGSYLGIVSMILVGSSFIASVYSGILLKRFITSKIAVICFFMTTAALIGFARSGAYISLCLFAVPLGFGLGLIDTALNNYVAVHFKAKHMSWLHCCWGVGATAGPIILSYGMKRFDSWHWGYYAIGGAHFGLALILILTLAWWKLAPERTKNKAATGRVKFRELFKLRGIILSLITFFVYCSIESIIGTWGSSYLVIVKSVEPKLAAQWIALYFLGMTLGRFLSGFLTIKLNNRWMVRLGCAILVFGNIVMILPFGEVFYLAGFLLMGLGCAPIFPCLIHNTPAFFGEENSPAIIGLQMASACIGAAVASALFGVAAARIGYEYFPLCLAALLIVMMVTNEALNKKSAL